MKNEDRIECKKSVHRQQDKCRECYKDGIKSGTQELEAVTKHGCSAVSRFFGYVGRVQPERFR